MTTDDATALRQALPPLPEPIWGHSTNTPKFSADQMHAYALAGAQPASGEPVAYINSDELDNMLDDRAAVIYKVQDGFRKTPLYAAPQTAPARLSAAPAQPVEFDAAGFRAFVARELPDDTIIGSSAWWADHLAAWAKRFARSAAPAQARQPLTGVELTQIELRLRIYCDYDKYDLSLHDFARAIEAAHGITAAPTTAKKQP